MLSFFRKYEKTFFLIVFLPAIVGMGITSVVVSVLSDKGPTFQGKVFGHEISPGEWDMVIRPYVKMVGRSDEGSDAHYRYFAYYTAAKDAGIRVPDSKVADQIVDSMQFYIAQLKAGDRIRREGIDTNTQEGMQRFRQYVIQYLSEGARGGFTEDEYNRYLQRYGVSIPEYEGYQKRELMRQELFDVVRHAATVTPDELWKELNDKEHKREGELVTLDAAAYVPSSGTVATDEEIKTYWDTHKELYDEPRRVNLEYVASPFEKAKAEIKTPAEEVLREYYEKHQKDYETKARVGSADVTVVKSFDQVKASIEEKVVQDRTRDLAQGLLEQVADKLDAQRKAGKVDLKAAFESVAAANTNTPALVFGETNLLEEDAIMTHPLLNGFAAYRWATTEPQSDVKTSDPLKGEKSVAILRTKQVAPRTSPKFEDVKAKVAKDFVQGGERELKKYYDANQWKYRTKDRWKVAYVTVDYDSFAAQWGNAEDPSDDEVAAFWKEHHEKRWPGKDVAAVDSKTVRAAAKGWKNRGQADKVIDAFRARADKNYGETKKANYDLLKGQVDEKGAGFVEISPDLVTVDRESLASHELLKTAEAFVPLAELQKPSELFPRPDGRGKFFVVVTEKLDQKTPELAEVRDQVVKDVLAARGYDRAKQAAEKLLLELKDLRGDKLAAALKAKGLEPKKTGVLPRTATNVPGVGVEGSQVVAELFQCEPEGGYERSVNADVDKKVFLIRCARRENPGKEAMANLRTTIRQELLRRKRDEYAQERIAQLTLDAKGVSREHVEWVRSRRDGPDGEVSVKARQIFVPNDKATIEQWLDNAARARIEQAFNELKKDVSWDKVVADFSEDDATKLLKGQMEAARGQLVSEYGFEFEEKVFGTKADNQVSEPIKSKKGFHLVRVTKTGTADDGHGHGGEVRVTFQHLLVKTDPKLRNLPKEVLDKARAISEEKIKKAKERLDQGEPFAKVAFEVGAADDVRAKGETFTAPWLTPLVRYLLRQPMEPISELPKLEPFEVTVPGPGGATTKEWHVALCARDPQDKEPISKHVGRAPRIAFECVSPSKDVVVGALRELEAWQKQKIAENRDPSFSELLKEWKRIVTRTSTAVTREKEGAFGLVALDSQLRDLPDAVLEAFTTTAAGQRSNVISSDEGFHLVEVLSVEKKPASDQARFREIADAVLRGTDWVAE